MLVSCVAVDPAGSLGPASTREVADKNYSIGHQEVASVGDTLIRVKNFSETVSRASAFKIPVALHIRAGMNSVQLGEGQEIPVMGTRVIDGRVYSIAVFKSQSAFGSTTEMALQVADDGSTYGHLVGRVNGRSWIQVMPSLSIDPAGTKLVPIVQTKVDSAPGNQNYEIIFSGIDGQAMHFDYREFTPDDLARPAFSQALSYPLASKAIRYRRLQIEVISVTAEQITYRVVADGR